MLLERNMRRYYFDFFDGEEVYRDSEGTDFESIEAMRTSAFKALLEIMGCQALTDGAELTMVVRNASELPALEAKLSLVVSYPARAPVCA
jgi:hypothetical protein